MICLPYTTRRGPGGTSRHAETAWVHKALRRAAAIGPVVAPGDQRLARDDDPPCAQGHRVNLGTANLGRRPRRRRWRVAFVDVDRDASLPSRSEAVSPVDRRTSTGGDDMTRKRVLQSALLCLGGALFAGS